MKFVVVASLVLCIHANADVMFSDLGTGSTMYSSDPGSLIKGSGAGGSLRRRVSSRYRARAISTLCRSTWRSGTT
jgi:hypothetical protein